MTTLHLEQKISRAERPLLITALGNELVIMDIEDGSYLNINEVGAVIWNLIEKPILVKDIISQLLANYEIDEQQCVEDLMYFLNELEANKLLKTLIA